MCVCAKFEGMRWICNSHSSRGNEDVANRETNAHRITNKVLKCWSKIHKFSTRQNGKNNVRNNLRLARIDRCRTDLNGLELVGFAQKKKHTHTQREWRAATTVAANSKINFCTAVSAVACVRSISQLLSNCKVERQNNKQQMQKPANGVK